MSYVFKDAELVKAEISKLIAAYPEIEEDTQLLADSLEGETGLYEILERALAVRQEADMMVSAIKEREAALEARRKRYEAQSAAYKALMLSLMQSASQDKVALVTATLSISKGRTSVEVENEDDLPQGTYSTKRVPDKAAIKRMIEAGESIPGASLKTSEDGLTIRSK